MKLGFAGLGQMGRHIARNLAKSDADLLVFARNSDALTTFDAGGVRTTSDISSLSDSDVLFLCLPNGQIVKEVLLGHTALAADLRFGAVVVDLSTSSYATTLAISDALVARGIAFLDAPVSGMEQRAQDGTLTIMCGGTRATFDAIRPYFQLFGENIFYMGQAGSGQATKLINQLLFDVNAAALAEILPMAVKLGLNPDDVAKVVNTGTGGSFASAYFLPRILRGDFSSGYSMQAAYKDLVAAAEISTNQGIPLPVLAAATATYQQALLRGYGDHDKGGMIRVFEDLLDVKFRSPDGGPVHG